MPAEAAASSAPAEVAPDQPEEDDGEGPFQPAVARKRGTRGGKDAKKKDVIKFYHVVAVPQAQRWLRDYAAFHCDGVGFHSANHTWRKILISTVCAFSWSVRRGGRKDEPDPHAFEVPPLFAFVANFYQQPVPKIVARILCVEEGTRSAA